MRNFFKSVVDTAERYRELPNKTIDTNVICLALAFNCLVVGGTVLLAKSSIVDYCLIPLLQHENHAPNQP
jgi:hypothetical protein